MRFGSRRGAVLLVVGCALAGPLVAPVAAAGATIVVNSVGDPAPGNDGLCTLREAILAANSNTKSGTAAGECVAGIGTDSIAFGFTSRTVTIGSQLPDIASSLTLNGAGSVTIDIAGHGHIEKASGTVTIKGATITHASNAGILNDLPGSLVVVDSTISGTTAGPAIYNGGTLTVQRSVLTGNTFTGGSGAGLYNNATATVLDSTISQNSADNGAGINNSGPLTVRRSTIADNNATVGYGGGIYNNSNATITASTLNGNTAAQGGGGLFTAFATTLANVTVADNSAGTAGGGINSNTNVTATNLTITRNFSGTPGSGYYNGLSAILVNTIVAGNVGGADYAGNGVAVGSRNNRITPIEGIVLSDVLDPSGLQDNGGPTDTVALVNVAGNQFNIAGDPTACAASPVSGVDQRGVTRPSSSCSVGAVQLERTAPTATGPTAGLRTSVTLSGTAVQARIAWTGKDNTGGSGIDHYRLDESINGGAWATVNASLTKTAVAPLLPTGKTYRFRVRAVDQDGNVSGWAYGATFAARLLQQSSSAVHYSGTWATTWSASFSGGSTRRSSSAGASASLTATGRAYAFVTTTGPTRGKAKVYVNGVLKATIDLRSVTLTYRVQAWSIRYSTSTSRTIKVVVVGTSGRPRVDVDAFVVLK
ncbi:MAG TPA: CSLREA domain-containing protein [Candidatus Limnocylindrales bacterium]